MRVKSPRTIVPAALAFSLLAGCAGYTYTLNERTVFEPAPLFADYAIADGKLRECVAQAISDGKVSTAEGLVDLNCSSAGIRDLSGIEVFGELRRLGLDDNAISDLAPLYALKKLELLQLRGNALQTVDARLCTGSATQIALAGNDKLGCADVEALAACGMVLTDQPAHCTKP